MRIIDHDNVEEIDEFCFIWLILLCAHAHHQIHTPDLRPVLQFEVWVLANDVNFISRDLERENDDQGDQAKDSY